MTTTEEQSEARQVEDARKQFPKWRWLGVWSRREKVLRLFKVAWIRGCGPGYGAPYHYNAALSVRLDCKPRHLLVGISWYGDRDEREFLACFFPGLRLRFHYRRSYGGWLMSPSLEPPVAPEHRRRWWQLFKAV